MALICDVQYREEQASEAINRKFHGVIPKGVYRGFGIAAGVGNDEVTISTENGLSIAVVDVDGKSVTVKQDAMETYILQNSGLLYLVLEVTYKSGLFGDPSYLPTTAVVKDILQGDLQDNHIILAAIVHTSGQPVSEFLIDLTPRDYPTWYDTGRLGGLNHTEYLKFSDIATGLQNSTTKPASAKSVFDLDADLNSRFLPNTQTSGTLAIAKHALDTIKSSSSTSINSVCIEMPVSTGRVSFLLDITDSAGFVETIQFRGSITSTNPAIDWQSVSFSGNHKNEYDVLVGHHGGLPTVQVVPKTAFNRPQVVLRNITWDSFEFNTQFIAIDIYPYFASSNMSNPQYNLMHQSKQVKAGSAHFKSVGAGAMVIIEGDTLDGTDETSTPELVFRQDGALVDYVFRGSRIMDDNGFEFVAKGGANGKFYFIEDTDDETAEAVYINARSRIIYVGHSSFGRRYLTLRPDGSGSKPDLNFASTATGSIDAKFTLLDSNTLRLSGVDFRMDAGRVIRSSSNNAAVLNLKSNGGVALNAASSSQSLALGESNTSFIEFNKNFVSSSSLYTAIDPAGLNAGLAGMRLHITNKSAVEATSNILYIDKNTAFTRVDINNNVRISSGSVDFQPSLTGDNYAGLIRINGKDLIRATSNGCAAFGADNATIIGSGESALYGLQTIGNSTTERLYLCSDQDIEFRTNTQGGWESGVVATLSTAGALTLPSYLSASQVREGSTRVYSPNNKPTYSDVGAAAASHDHYSYMYKKGALGSSVDLNSLVETGYYTQGSNSNAASGSNYPESRAGILEVLAGSDSHIVQRYTIYDQRRVWSRYYYSGTWYAWVEITANDQRPLSSSVTSTSTSTAATSNAVKIAYDRAETKLARSGGTMEGSLKLNNNVNFYLGSSNDTRFWFSGSHTYLDTRAHGSYTYFRGENSGGVLRTALRLGGGSNQVVMYYEGSTRLETSIGGATVTGTLQATDVSITSDMRKKNKIRDISNGLAKVKKLTTFAYTLKDKFLGDGIEKREMIGLSAQELRGVQPELVNEDEQGYLSVSYDRIVVLLIDALKEVDKRLETIEGKLSGI